MPVAEIITIGTEILLGETIDTNATYLSKQLRELGIDLYRITSIGDNLTRIVQAIREALERAQIIITTGGLGPTVDDVTRQAIATALDRDLVFQEDLWQGIIERFKQYNRQPTENNKQQAHLPEHALAVINPVGTAPAFIVQKQDKVIFSLPGVPHEMEYLMQNSVIPYLRKHFKLESVIKCRVLRTAGVGESQIDELLADLETLTNPTVGLAAHSGRVDIRITAKASDTAEATAKIKTVENTIRSRLGEWIFGVDGEKLEEVALRNIENKGWKLITIEVGLNGCLSQRLAAVSGPFKGGLVLPVNDLADKDLIGALQLFQESHQAQVALGITLIPSEKKQELDFVLISPQGIQTKKRSYGGHPANAATWATNIGINMLRFL